MKKKPVAKTVATKTSVQTAKVEPKENTSAPQLDKVKEEPVKEAVKEVIKAAEPVKEAAKEEAVKAAEAVKAVEKKAVEKKADAKLTEKVSEATGKATEKVTAAKTAVKTAAKKTAAKVAANVLAPEIFIQHEGREIAEEEVLTRIKDAYVAGGHRLGTIKSLQVYIKPEENAAYYVINKKITGSVYLF